MSFGFSITDFKEVIKLSWDLYVSLKEGPEEIKNIARDLATIYGVLNHIHDDISGDDSAIKAHGEGRVKMLQTMTLKLKATLDEVQRLVDKFRPMAATSKIPEQLWIKVKWVAGQKRIKRIHQDISFHISSFNLLMTSMGNSSLRRIEAGLQEMRFDSHKGSESLKSARTNTWTTETTARDDDQDGDVDNEVEVDDEDVEDDQRMVPAPSPQSNGHQRKPRSPPTGTANTPAQDVNSDNGVPFNWPKGLTPAVTLRSPEFVARIESLSTGEQSQLAEIIFANCRTACFDFYRNNALWRAKFATSDTSHDRRLFELDNGTFPKTPNDLDLVQWLLKIRYTTSSIAPPDAVSTMAFWDYNGMHSTFAWSTRIPALIDVFDKIDTDVFEECLLCSIHLCQHLQAWNAAGRLKALWKMIHTSSLPSKEDWWKILAKLEPGSSTAHAMVGVR
ncbi:uncharacterized protein PV06_02993 [Exophiala oligosperma]|uniref:Fungal N-terminal domain-containing protein n=1 Tax=Exophiala oligosperma TaxID=215243 RepID=A0A0D2C469_9EURO|nr:uncharacterized protein PV06_02993 [Exophiala oligosperma]KIW44532.1 hypothetical protein PV06_02993 [Exophiala oligosperma]